MSDVKIWAVPAGFVHNNPTKRQSDDVAQVVLASDHEREVAALRAALESIAANTCCERCQEAALVARAALNQ